MSRVIVTKGVQEYRQTIPSVVFNTDIVLEIGCAWGTTSNLLFQRAKALVAIDKGQSLPTAARTYPHIRFEQIDGFDVSSILRLGYRFNKVYIDISGCRELPAVMKIIMIYREVFQPEAIVMKSSRLKRFVSACQVWGNERGFERERDSLQELRPENQLQVTGVP